MNNMNNMYNMYNMSNMYNMYNMNNMVNMNNMYNMNYMNNQIMPIGETPNYISYNQNPANFQTPFNQNNINSQVPNNFQTPNFYNSNQTAGNFQPNFTNINPSMFQNNYINNINTFPSFNINNQINQNIIINPIQNNNNINNNNQNNNNINNQNNNNINQNNSNTEREKEIIGILKKAEYKLSDFGLSKIRNDIKARNLAGSPLYMSPELFNPSASIKTIENYQVDIWALGVLAFEMFFGRRPFEAFSIEELSKMYKKQTYYINLDNITISKQFFSFLNMCLQKDPQKRADVKKLKNSKFVNDAFEGIIQLNREELLECLGNKVQIDEKNNNIYLSIDEIYFKDEDI